MLDYTKWGALAPLSWVQMLWKSLHYFDITLYMSYPTTPRKHDQVIMEIIFSHDLDATTIQDLNRCRGLLEALFLSDITTADGKYLEHFVFDPGGRAKCSRYTFPREQPTRQDWDSWINFWHASTNTGGKLKCCWADGQTLHTKYGCGTIGKKTINYIVSTGTRLCCSNK
jgi:hypothetical protein